MRMIMGLVLLGALGAQSAFAVEVGSDGPDFEFKKTWNALPNAKAIKDYRGKAVLLEVWATW